MHGFDFILFYSIKLNNKKKDRFMPPTFVLPKRSLIELEYGKSINLTCQANGLPKPRVRWIEGVCLFSSYLIIFF